MSRFSTRLQGSQHDSLNGEAEAIVHLGEIATRHDSGRLVVDAALEASRAPVHELDCAIGLDGGHGSVHVLGHNVAAVHNAAE